MKHTYQLDFVIWKTSSQSGNYNEDVEYEIHEQIPLTRWNASFSEIKDTVEVLPMLTDYLVGAGELDDIFTHDGLALYCKLSKAAQDIVELVDSLESTFDTNIPQLTQERANALLKEHVYDFCLDMLNDIYDQDRGHASQSHFTQMLAKIERSQTFENTYSLFKEVVFPSISFDQEVVSNYLIQTFVENTEHINN